MVVEIAIDPNFRTRLHLVQPDDHAVLVNVDDVTLQFPVSDLRRADGLTLDFADDARGKGLIIDNPNAPKPVRNLSPAEAEARVRTGTLTLVDVRPRDERSQAIAPVAHRDLDDGVEAIEALPKDTPIAFLCHHGGRSAQAAEHFRALGFKELYNVAGGIVAWADLDPAVPRY